MKVTVLSVILALIPFVLGQAPPRTTTVTTPQGRFHGNTASLPGYGTVNYFLGIPFAKPPTGGLRYKPPQKDDTVYQDYNATYFRHACVQDINLLRSWSFNSESLEIGEDCLYLNVYVPSPNSGNLPVMVWIHGGGFIFGSGASYDARRLAAQGQVIVVTINYRLGVLGFFPNGKTESTLGLQDQIMALEWVKKTISSFGGDPNEVTIFGESAGAESVSLLSFSPRARGLFRRAICQSGVATGSWLIIPGNAERKMGIIEKSVHEDGCTAEDLLECVRGASAEKLIELTTELGFTQPEIDNDVIMPDFKTNQSLIHPGVETIIGVVPNEGAIGHYVACTSYFSKECDVYRGVDAKTLVETEAPADISGDLVHSIILHYNYFYPMDVQPGNMNMLAATKFSTDFQYRVPSNVTATYLTDNGFKVRMYEFNVASEHNRIPVVPWSSEAQHMDDLAFVFGMHDEGVKGQVANTMIKLWTDFAKGRLTNRAWPQFTTRRGEYLYIDEDYIQGQTRAPFFPLFKNAFWRNYLEHGVFPPYSDHSTSSAGTTKPATTSAILMFTAILYTVINRAFIV